MTDTQTNRSDTPRVWSDGWWTRHGATLTRVGPLLAVIVGALIVAAVSFVLSYYGLNDYMRRVAHFPANLSWLGPIGIDGMTVVAGAAVAVLRRARWPVKAYAWAVFAIPVALSMAGQVSHAKAVARQAGQDVAVEGVIGACVWPPMLGLALHLVVIAWRHLEATTRPAVAPVPVPARRAPVKAAPRSAAKVEPAPVASDELDRALSAALTQPPAPDTARRPPKPGRRAGGRDAGQYERARDIARRNPDLPAAEIARLVGHGVPRTVQRWVSDLQPATSPNGSGPR